MCGRLKSDYSYSINVVYNNFPWPTPTEQQKAKIEQTAKAILDARALYPDSSLADLYDDLTMPPELRKAHQANDRAVMDAYGFIKGTAARTSESACVTSKSSGVCIAPGVCFYWGCIGLLQSIHRICQGWPGLAAPTDKTL